MTKRDKRSRDRAKQGAISVVEKDPEPRAPIVKCNELQTLVVRLHEMKARADSAEEQRDSLEVRLADLEVELGSKRRELALLRARFNAAVTRPALTAEMMSLSKSVDLEDGKFVKDDTTGEWFLHREGCSCGLCK